MTRVLSALAALAVVMASFAFFGNTAYGHESRMLGPYRVVVGWVIEPAFARTLNMVDFRVTDTRATPAAPVLGVEKTIPQVEVVAGTAAPITVPLLTRSGMPGAYQARLTPTALGSYSFTFKGKIESLDVNEKFTASPGTFGLVMDPAELEYPVKQPTAAELSANLAELSANLAKQIADLKSQLSDVQASVNAKVGGLQSSVDQMQAFALGGLGLGAVALLLSTAALMRRRV